MGLGTVNVPDSINTAERVLYNNASSKLSAETVQAAIDETTENAKAESFDSKISVALLLNYARQQSWEIEHGQVELTNNAAYPANNSKRSVALTRGKDSSDYIVLTEIVGFSGNAGEVEISEKLVNGFKIAFNGSATRVIVKYTVIGGFMK